jgi:hypothetical protein
MLKTRLIEMHEHVKVGVSKWFKSDLSQIKQWTQMVAQDEDEELPEELEEGEELPEDPNANKFLPDIVHVSK